MKVTMIKLVTVTFLGPCNYRISEEITHFLVPVHNLIIFIAAEYSYYYTEIVKLNIICIIYYYI